MKYFPESRVAKRQSVRFVFLPVLATLALLLIFTACSGFSASAPSQTGVTTASTGKASLSPSPATINFGTVQLNSKAVTSVINLTNVGKSAEIIESATIVPTAAFSLQGLTGAVTLKPGQTIQLRTTFAPTSAGNYSGKLTLVTWGVAPVESAKPVDTYRPSWPPQPMGQVNIPVIGAASAEKSPPPVVGVSVSPGSVRLQSGQSKQFTSAVTGTSNTAVTWTAELGSISSSGFYTAPTFWSQIVDTVSAVSAADPTKYASASVTVSVNTGSVNTFYVDPVNGKDANNGTSQATAWKTICKANSAATLGTNGTLINLLPGTFTLSAQGSCVNSNINSPVLTLNGTSTQRVVWQCVNDPRSSPNSCIFNGGNASNLYIYSNYSDFIQLEITGATIDFGDNVPTPTYGNNDSLQKSYIHDMYNSCPQPSGQGGAVYAGWTSTNGIADSNIVNNIGVMGNCPNTGASGQHGIYIAGYHWQVTNNLVSNASGYGIHSYHDACENNITNNTVVHNYTGGLLLSAGPNTSYGCTTNGGNRYTVDNNVSIYNSWGCGVVAPGSTAAIQGGMIVYNTGSGSVNNVGYNNYLISNWTSTGSRGCTNSAGTNNSFVYDCDSGSCPNGQFAGDPGTTFSSTTVPSNGFVSPCSTSTLGSTACNVIPVARGGSWDWHIISGGPFDGAGGSGCSGSPGYTSPCVPTYDAAGVTRTLPSSVGAYQSQ